MGGGGACLQQLELTAPFVPAQVNVSFSLSLELLSYQKLPADQMLPGVDIRQHASGEKEMVFTQSLLLEYANHTTQVSPGPAPHRGGCSRARLFSGVRGQTPTRSSETRGAPAHVLRALSALEEDLP